MDLARFIAESWTLIEQHPRVFVVFASICATGGFAFAALFYRQVAILAKERREQAEERLERARDDLARLEAAKSVQNDELAFLRTEIAELRADVARQPRIRAGEGPPPADSKEGDVYFQLGPAIKEEMFLRSPLRNLDQALAMAATEQKGFFVVIYDPSHSDRSRMGFCLGYFLST